MEEIKITYLHIIRDIDMATKIAYEALNLYKETKTKADKLTLTNNFLMNVQMSLFEGENQIDW